MTRVAIIQRLLDLRQITAQEAVTLLEKEYVYNTQPYYYNNPWPGIILTSGTFSNVSGIAVTSSYAPGTTTTYTAGEQLNLFADGPNKS